ncbi:MAG: alpha/beta hydrolase, partial [Betaproteobacteria bacterium]|nr:alpha/beta hydrolase [Betaproteobacteria bacterium]
SAEYQRTGFQGGLQWYRCRTQAGESDELLLYSGRTIDVPSMFVAGASDWGVYQKPGAYEAMLDGACSRMTASHLVAGAGHWIQQEQPEAVTDLLLRFLQDRRRG